jgi:hypothetical protein
MGVGYNLSACIFGGTTPLFCTLLVGSPLGLLAIGIYLSAAALVAMVCHSLIQREEDKRLKLLLKSQKGYGTDVPHVME